MSSSSNLATRYRPHRFAELTGQRHVAAVLTGAVVQGRMPQQLLFTGGSGLGKTTVARIAAAAVLCQTSLGERDAGDACGQCSSCQLIAKPQSEHPDVIELDAASHGGKDEIVAIVSRAQTKPLLGPFKVYIIDEIHALSGAGVQAFLKLLEEPPAHVLFMLATTNPEKLSSRAGGTGTIRGRCVEFELLPPTAEELSANLLRVAAGEGWPLSAEAAAMVVDVSDPALGVRGTINTLAKLSSLLQEGRALQTAEVVTLLGATPRQAIFEVTEAIRRRDLAGALEGLSEARRFSSDRRVRDALTRWAREGLDSALRGEASLSPQLALQRFELLLSAPEGHLHTDLVVARLARPATVTDGETLAAQLHEAHRVLTQLDRLLPAEARTVGRHDVEPAAYNAPHKQEGAATFDVAAETLTRPAPAGALPAAGAAQETEPSVASSTQEADDVDDVGDVDDSLDRTSTVAGTFDDLSDLSNLPARQHPGLPEPEAGNRTDEVGPGPQDHPVTSARDAPTTTTQGVSELARSGERSSTRDSAPKRRDSRQKTAAQQDSRARAATLNVEAFVAAAGRQSPTAAALVRSVEASTSTAGGSRSVRLRVPEGLRHRIQRTLPELQAAAEELSATLSIVGADAEPDRAAHAGSREQRKDTP